MLRRNARGDALTTFGGGLMVYPSGNLRASFIYEHVTKQDPDRASYANLVVDTWTAQLQAKF